MIDYSDIRHIGFGELRAIYAELSERETDAALLEFVNEKSKEARIHPTVCYRYDLLMELQKYSNKDGSFKSEGAAILRAILNGVTAYDPSREGLGELADKFAKNI